MMKLLPSHLIFLKNCTLTLFHLLKIKIDNLIPSLYIKYECTGSIKIKNSEHNASWQIDRIIKLLIFELQRLSPFFSYFFYNCHTTLSCSQLLALNSEQYNLAQNFKARGSSQASNKS